MNRFPNDVQLGDVTKWQKEFRIPNGNGFYLTTYVNDTPVRQE